MADQYDDIPLERLDYFRELEQPIDNDPELLRNFLAAAELRGIVELSGRGFDSDTGTIPR